MLDLHAEPVDLPEYTADRLQLLLVEAWAWQRQLTAVSLEHPQACHETRSELAC